MKLNKEQTEVLDTLRKDWLERDSDGYVFKGAGRYSWSNLPKATALSSLLQSANDPRDLIKRSYVMASRTVRSLHLPHIPIIRFDEGSYTDGKNIAVSTTIFDDENLDNGQKCDGFIGYAVHEAAHILYSDFANIRIMPDKFSKNVLNIIEDERIERMICKERNFLAGYLRMSKIHSFVSYEDQVRASRKGLTTVQNLTNAIVSLVRFPSIISEQDVVDFGPELMQIRKEVLCKIAEKEEPTADDMKDGALKIREIVKKFLEEQKKQEQEKEKNQQQQQQQQNSGNDSDNSPSQDDSNGDSDQQGQQDGNGQSEQNSDGHSQKSSSSAQGDDNNRNDQQDTSSGSGSSQQMSDEEREQMEKEISKELDDAAEMIQSLSKEPFEQLENEDVGSLPKYDDYLEKECTGEVSLLENGNVVVEHCKNTVQARVNYMDSLGRIKKYVPALRNVLEYNAEVNEFCIRGQKCGRLDSHKYIQGYLGSENIYTQRGKVAGGRIAVCVLIDNSGSMYGQKIGSARDMAVLLMESLKGLPNVDSYFYGHTTEHKVIISEFDKDRQEFAIGDMKARGGNMDNIAILETAKMVREKTDEEVLFFVISDGDPNCSYADVKNAVKTVEGMGMSVVSIGIGFVTGGLYKNHIDFRESELSTFPSKLGKIISTALENKTAREVM